MDIFGASNLYLNKRDGVGFPCVDFKNRSTCRDSEDRNEPSPRFTSNGIHMKSGVDNLQGHGLRRTPGASQVSIRRGRQNPISPREVHKEHSLKTL